MSKRDTYNAVLAEVESDKALVTIAEPTSYMDMVEAEGVKLALPEEGVLLKSATSAFADYAVRDALLIKSMEDEEFSFILVNKIGNTVAGRVRDKNVSQDDVEALATAGQILTMWEQFKSAEALTALLDNVVAEFKLAEPSLANITKRLLGAKAQFPFKQTRIESVREIGDKALEGLDNE